MDCLQPPGSFKIRGIGETVRIAAEAGASRIVSSSGGNAGLAAAFAARSMGVPATVVLPTTTPEAIHVRLKRYGAEVVVHGDVWDEADQEAQKIVKEKKGAYVHPFDQPSTWKGHSTIVEELSRQLPRAPDAIVTCVGGGGLLMGILKGVEACGWMGSTRVVPCETEGAASMAESLAAGKLITRPITSIAKSLGASTVSKTIFEHCRDLGPKSVTPFVMSDAAALSACIRLAADHRVLVEPACGAALAAVTERSEALADCDLVVVEVCGGAIVDLALLNAWAQQVGVPMHVEV
jgi:L-serine/L-threonine ammonia-lyase